MPQIQRTADVHEKTVQKVAKNAVMVGKPRRRNTPRPRSGRVTVVPWYKDLDPMLLAWCRANKIYWKRVEILSPTEIIIHDEEI